MPSIRWGHVLPSPLRLLAALLVLIAGIASDATVVGAQTGVAANNSESATAVEVAAGGVRPAEAWEVPK